MPFLNKLAPVNGVLALPNSVVTELCQHLGKVPSDCPTDKYTVPISNVVCRFTNSLLAAELKNQLVSIDRKFAETDYNYRQLLPYVVFVCHKTDRVLQYKRGKAGSESRLHDLRSIGFGGHIDSKVDYLSEAQYRYQFDQVIFDNIKREVKEELGWTFIEPTARQFVGLLVSDNPDPKEVGHYHLALLFVVQVSSDMPIEPENGNIELPEWVSLDELDKLNLEPWSHAAKSVIKTYI